MAGVGRGSPPLNLIVASSEAMKEAENALKALREARDTEGQRRAADALERAVRKLKGHVKPEAGKDQR
jgi:hypothetical protein